MTNNLKLLILFFAGVFSTQVMAIDEGYVLTPSVWPKFDIPVCWEGDTTQYQTEKSWVRKKVANTWEKYSRVRFLGWSDCSSGSNSGIRIKVRDDNPHVKRLGRYLAGITNGMELNFDFQNWECNPKKSCIENISVHEFGHALGFAHEQNRPDTPQWCQEEQGTNGDVVVGDWDINSVMNYCNPIWGNRGKLSTGDIATVQQFYSSRFQTVKKWIGGFSYDDGDWRVGKNPRVLADVNGDGKDDIVGFSNRGVYVALSEGNQFATARKWINGFTHDDGGWREGKNPRYLSDVNGDGKDDLVGFSNSGVYVALSTGSSFSSARKWIGGFSHDDGGWRAYKNPRFLSDVNGDGRDDRVGFANVGVYVALSNGNGFEQAQKWVHSYARDVGGWRVDRNPRIMADVNGDGKDDIVGFANEGVYVSTSNGSSFTAPEMWVSGYGYNAGWRVNVHPREVVDINGDGRKDIIGFGDGGVSVSLSQGNRFSETKIWLDTFGNKAGGWSIAKYPRLMADVNGDGKSDIVGFAHDGTYVSLKRKSTTSFQRPVNWIATFGYAAGGWRVSKNPRLMGDINGDGRADVVAFSNSGVYVALSY